MKPRNPPQRTRGIVRMWDDEKGFGFIKPDEGGRDVYLHLRAFGGSPARPSVGMLVTYCLSTDEIGRPRAAFARVEAGGRPAELTFRPLPAPAPPRHALAPQRRRQRPRRSSSVGWAFLGSAGFIGALAWAAQLHHIEWWVPAVYGGASGFTFIAYASDKARAVDAEWRVSENTLHLLELLGGWPGALFAQQCLRHKTAKLGYQVIFWLIVMAHVGLWTWWAFEQGKKQPFGCSSESPRDQVPTSSVNGVVARISLVVIDRLPVFSRSKSAWHSRDRAVGFPHLEARRSCGFTRAVADQRQTVQARRWRFF